MRVSDPVIFRGARDPFVVIALCALAVGGCSKSALPNAAPDADPVADALIADGAPAPDTAGSPDRPVIDGTVPDTAKSDAVADAAEDPLPAQCRVTTNRQPPFQVTFRLVNRGPRPVYLHQGCGSIAFGVSSCASRYTDNLGPTFVCACDCSDPGCRGGVACGPCLPDTGVEVAPGATKDVTWAAQTVALQDRGTFSCAQRTFLPAALYAVSVPVFDSAQSAVAGSALRFASRTFALPAAGDLVEVPLPAALPDGGAPDAASCERAGPAPVCAAPWSPDLACSLDTAVTFAWEGGLSLWADGSALTPPATYTRTRTFHDQPPRPPLTCSNLVPRCGASNDTFTTADVMEALAAPDVVAALAQPMPLVYGYDYRANDGSVLVVKRADGHGLIVGLPCGAGRPCERPITAGMTRLAAILGKLDGQQLAAPGCEALRQP
jgi:hypothetical protein